MRKWTKRIGAGVLVLSGLLVVLVLVSWWMLRGTPEWYQPPALSEAERADAANRADQKVADTLSWAAGEQAAEARRRLAMTRPAIVVTAAPTKTITFTDSELNSVFQKWDTFYGWKDSYGRYLSDPVLVLRDGRILIAAKVNELNAVASLHFAPRIDNQGRLQLNLVRVLGGKLPLPQGFLTKYRSKLTGVVAERLPRWQQKARIDPDGSANDPAVEAAMGKLLLNIFAREAGEPVVFLPTPNGTRVPVQINDVQVEKGAVTLTVQAMNETERAALLQRIKAPPRAVAASGN